MRWPAATLVNGPPLNGDGAEHAAIFLDALAANVCGVIVAKVHEGAMPLLKRGYWADELVIEGFGEGIVVRPGSGRAKGRFVLWARRAGRRLGMLPQSDHPGDLQRITIMDPDTYRIVRRFHLLSSAAFLENAKEAGPCR